MISENRCNVESTITKHLGLLTLKKYNFGIFKLSRDWQTTVCPEINWKGMYE